MTPEDQIKLYANWTDDCQGKKDYDGPIIEISTRYWPRGGGFHVFDRDSPSLGMQGNESRPEIKPSANCSLIICCGPKEDGDGGGDSLTLIEQEFEGETFEEVAAQVEAFAQAQTDRVVSLLKREYSSTAESEQP